MAEARKPCPGCVGVKALLEFFGGPVMCPPHLIPPHSDDCANRMTVKVGGFPINTYDPERAKDLT